MRIFPSKHQWSKWSLPSKLTLIGTYIGILSFVISIITLFPNRDKEYSTFVESDNFKVSINSVKIYEIYPDTVMMNLGRKNAVTEYDLNYPKLIFEDNTYIEHKINELIKAQFLNLVNLDVSNIKNTEFSGSIISNYNKTYKIRNLLGLKIETHIINGGAAHGTSYITPLNINLKNGTLFDFSDLFKLKETNSINQLINQKLLNHNCRKSIFEDIDNNEIDSFYFETNSLVIVFDQYKIAASYCGPIEIHIIFKEIIEYVNPQGPLGFLVNY